MDFNKIKNILENREVNSIDERYRSAVLIPLIKVNNNWEVLFELRSNNMNSQPGEVSFPGGKMEKNESFKETAIRETMEELNINKSNINILGELDYLVSPSGMTIHCFLGTISGVIVDNISPNPDEVDHLFTVPLDYFLNNEPDIYKLDMVTKYNEEFPYQLIPNGKDYNFNVGNKEIHFYRYNDYVIWGFTAKMMYHCVNILKEIKEG